MDLKADPIISIENLSKTYKSGFKALENINLEIRRGEIFGLLGPNGAGKTTLISIICGVVNPSTGTVTVDGFDIQKDYRETRRKIGLVPQELATDAFERVRDTVSLSRGLFGKAPNSDFVEEILKELSLWDKRDNRIRTLSGGMKRRVMIAKALVHEPLILFLDEPTAGVDVSLRRDMWELVRELRRSGVTIILTTHYIEEAEEMADRIGVLHQGKLMVVEEKTELLHKFGKRQLTLDLRRRINTIPDALSKDNLTLTEDGLHLVHVFDTRAEESGLEDLMKRVVESGIQFNSMQTRESSLEEIFVSLVETGT